MDAYEVEREDKDFEDELNMIYDEVELFGLVYGAGTVLREVDPEAFRCMKSDAEKLWTCAACGCIPTDFDEAEDCCKES